MDEKDDKLKEIKKKVNKKPDSDIKDEILKDLEKKSKHETVQK